ncbi:MAG: site-specific integrase [Actinomyces urogenitalis]|uniref:tyrosine-type recombinase/integrase n=1 Tax=Actinomyces urogenitalis TaxID=103621 RepID=UPI0006607D6C|nr:tyrosine-type recombinase/integrase [Actinomyces urogenitalis]MBS6071721.1 site-specific integrase [Actinomyces urogenitalis]MDU0864610.1 site-specific integrase [Actinomyces urogenitalis]MDU0875156.1 site-specific integrase [Actinomyces urogenitalis]MDU1564597.1 site-specific integrase [Actinomyces urogenitalis]MDU1640162.1 site-specific integrase [Actinomyces urogenitalis]
MSSIRHKRRKDGTVSHQVLFRHEGRQTSATFENLDSARRFSRIVDELGPAEALAILDQAPQTPSSLVTLGDHAHRYIDSLTGVQEDTRARYRRQVDGPLSSLAVLPLVAVSTDAVHAWVNEQEADGFAPKTIANRHGLLSAILADAQQRGMIDRNPAAGTRLPRGLHQEMVFLTPQQFAALRSVTPEHYRPLITFLASAGLRWSEATALTVADLGTDAVNVNKAWKKVAGGFKVGPPKTRRANRHVALAPDVATALAALAEGRKRTEPLFTTPAGTTVRHNVFFQYVWAPVTRLAMGQEARAKQAGRSKVSSLLKGVEPLPKGRALDVRPRIHDLRHTAASWMIAAGLDLVTVQYMLGHESVTTTADLYGHLLPERRKAAADAMSAMLKRAAG